MRKQEVFPFYLTVLMLNHAKRRSVSLSLPVLAHAKNGSVSSFITCVWPREKKKCFRFHYLCWTTRKEEVFPVSLPVLDHAKRRNVSGFITCVGPHEKKKCFRFHYLCWTTRKEVRHQWNFAEQPLDALKNIKKNMLFFIFKLPLK